jgi:hypothetical protein
MNTLIQKSKLNTRILFAVMLAFMFLAPAITAQTLVGHWQMESNLTDASGNGNNGTAFGSPTYDAGVIGQAINLNGTTQYASVTDPGTSSLDITTNFSMAAWFKPEIQGTQRIIFKVSGSSGYEVFLQNATPGVISVRFNGNASYRVNSTTFYTSNLNKWIHVAATYDGATIKLYINGVKENELAATFTIGTHDLALGLGASDGGLDKLRGAIDDVRIYSGSAVLNDSEISTLASSIPPPVLNTPANGSIGQPIPNTLSWYASLGATSYTVQVSTASDFSSFAYNTSGIVTTSTSVSTLSMNTLYYWRVRSTTGSGDSPWSTVWNFTTMNVPVIVNNGAGYCINFNGTNNRVTVPDNNTLDLTTSATIEAWFKPNSTGTTQRIVCKGNSSGYELYLTSSGFIGFRINFNDTYRVISSNAVTTGTWINVAGTYNGTTMRLYINGVQEGGDVAGISISTNTAPLSIGSRSDGTEGYLNGAVDEVRLWNVARTQADIQANMCKKLTGSESGLIGYWRFSEDSGTSMNDETSNNFDGTLAGTISGTTHDWSGAALGNASFSDYTGSVASDFSVNLGISSETFTATGSGGTITGIQVYRVDDVAFRSGSSTLVGLKKVDPMRYWGVKVFGTGSPTYSVVYNYNGHPGIISEDSLRLAVRDNLADVSWVDVTATLDTAANTLTIAGQTGTEYALATISLDPLPVELSSFSASVTKTSVKLKWRTETEVSNYGFEVQRSEKNNSWEVLGFVPGNGNSNSPKNYSFTDDNVTPGKYSYRLKQIDTDGQFSYSKTIAVDFGSAVKFELSQNYPNPFNPVTTIQFSIPQSSNVKLTVFNILGEQVAELVNGFRDAGIHTINFDASQFNSGLYIYKIESNGLVQTRKMLLVK